MGQEQPSAAEEESVGRWMQHQPPIADGGWIVCCKAQQPAASGNRQPALSVHLTLQEVLSETVSYYSAAAALKSAFASSPDESSSSGGGGGGAGSNS